MCRYQRRSPSLQAPITDRATSG